MTNLVADYDALQENLARWAFDPNAYFIECLGVEPTNQQLEVGDALQKLVIAKNLLKNGTTLTKEQWWYAKCPGISICSAKACGKDAVVVWVSYWAQSCWDEVKIPCTGPSEPQLRTVLWTEFHKWRNYKDPTTDEYAFLLREFFDIRVQNIYRKDWLTKAIIETNLAFPRVAQLKKDGTTSTLGGLHAPVMIIPIDEAQDVSDAVVEPLFTTTTDWFNIIMAIWNPLRNKGFAYDTHFGLDAKDWIKLQWDYEKSSRCNPAHVDKMETKYRGRHTNKFKIYVNGIPSTQEDGTFIPVAWAYEARIREPFIPDMKLPRILGIDVGGCGEDPTVAVVRHGANYEKKYEVHEPDIDRLNDWVHNIFKAETIDVICIETTGLGWSLFSKVKKWSEYCFAIDVSKPSRQPTKYVLVRDELWGLERNELELGLVSYPNDWIDAVDEISTPRLVESIAAGKRIKIEKREKIILALGHSPNIASAMIMTRYVNEQMMYNLRRDKNDYGRDRRERGSKRAQGRTWRS